VTFENEECAPVGRGTGQVGDACDSTADCGGGVHGFCLTEAHGWPDGYCSRDCYNTLSCPTGSHCAFVNNNTTAGYCMDDCTSTCRSGYTCFDADSDFSEVECYP
jgi:hypothetical protein